MAQADRAASSAGGAPEAPVPSAEAEAEALEVPPPAGEAEAVPDVPPPPAVAERGGPLARERKEIHGWLQKVHRQIGHRDNRTLVRLLKQRGTHPWVLKMAQEFRCSACEESRPPDLRHVTSSYETVPGAILEIDGMHWQHPVSGRHARCQFMVDVGS
eukprot:1431185-Lingulodinium_polyedra.AAC.1